MKPVALIITNLCLKFKTLKFKTLKFKTLISPLSYDILISSFWELAEWLKAAVLLNRAPGRGSQVRILYSPFFFGGVAEWSDAAVLKTVVVVRRP